VRNPERDGAGEAFKASRSSPVAAFGQKIRGVFGDSGYRLKWLFLKQFPGGAYLRFRQDRRCRGSLFFFFSLRSSAKIT
jgi:hypothetical protein